MPKGVEHPLKLVGEFLGTIAAEVTGAIGELQDAFSEVASLIGDVAADLGAMMRELFDALRPVLTEIGGVLLAPLRFVTSVIRELAAWITRLVAEVRDLLGLPAAHSGPAKSSEGMAFRQVSTGTTDSFLRKMQESSFGLGKEPDPAKETARSTSTMAEYMRQLVEEVKGLPAGMAARLAEFLRQRAEQTRDTLVGAAVAPWQAAREAASRVFG